ncbi:hypothetical protein GCM10008018_43400 [Paenibacillus marchantiophytorum]|uniref:Sigma-54 factor interaction domain-containing protein n=1 Tax=Paenibacillus marchantiophytorum TaxID=1619310 RepID=A0ABQ1EXU8_9BACL|nr:hypothetical protein GCM10008018_43400 [Paenibacillus marchantiophytorum]
MLLATNKGAEETLEHNKKLWANTAAVKNGKVNEIDFDQFLSFLTWKLHLNLFAKAER